MIITRTSKESALTYVELDGNFTNLNNPNAAPIANEFVIGWE